MPPKPLNAAPIVNAETVERVAKLARLELDEAERDALVADLQRILAFVNQLQAVDTDGVEPMIHTTSDTAPLRPDRAQPALGTAATLANAPAHAGGCFVVPRVVGG